MGEIQRVTLDGKNYVLLSEDDFEDLIDGLKADAILARIAAGEETWPAELVYELWETDSQIRTFRKYRGLTAAELAEAAGMSEPDVYDLENGKRTGDVDVLKRIATALKVDLDDLAV
uniref:helix-turn-helix domain-containing protein n=1 Tax=uncultured Rhizobium sp. TaxID=155567 RepID=UPI002611FCA2|nr:helix-turn-helix transcriptional regulator [uncultured Rhizobium sp.]